MVACNLSYLSMCLVLHLRIGMAFEMAREGGAFVCHCCLVRLTNRRYGASLGGALCYINNPTLRLFSHTCLHFSRTCLHTMSDDDQTRRHKKHKTTDKHHHHGGGAARPTSGVDLMNPHRPRGRRPCACSFRCRRRSDLIDSIN
jgi:hypothetical protein